MENKERLLLELYVEEIPPFELYKLNDFFKTEIEKFLNENDISFEDGKILSTPRRVAYLSSNVSSKQANKDLIVYGPYKHIAFDSEGNPTKVLSGFLKGKNKNLEDLSYESDKKGEKIFFKETIKGKTIEQLINDFVNKILIKKAPFAKSMKWASNNYTFIRPIHSILALYGENVLNVEYENLKASNKTRGHLILANKVLEIKSPSEYESKLKENFVIPSSKERKDLILSQIKEIEEKNNFKVMIDEHLLKEVINIVEYPASFIGTFSDEFLDLPAEVLIISMKKHQKYFPIYDNNNNITNYFLGVANVPLEGRESIINGNQRVLKARLSDAKFFYEDDLKKGLDILIPKLESVLFQKKLGSYADKVERIKNIALALNKSLNYGVSEEKIKESANLIKVDLLTGIVGEFAGLQGIIGTHYAQKLGYDKEVALTIMEHYQPKTVNDEIPSSDLSILMAMSDKLDTLVGGFTAGLAPTGSKDPFALRRASLSILKIMTQKNDDLQLKDYFINPILILENAPNEALLSQLIDFFKERFKFFLKNNYKSDVVDAVTLKSDIINKTTVDLCDALNNFKDGDESRKLILLIKRITNILKEDLFTLTGEINTLLLQTEEEKELFNWLQENSDKFKKLFIENNFKEAFELALTSYHILDSFFEKVLVNDENEDIKKNRQLLLKNLYSLLTNFVALEKLVIG
jgi:glycyl-tRNA synthetase beta chain